jgi:hypothetical protein
LLTGGTHRAECQQVRDKYLEGALQRLDEGLANLKLKYPNSQKPLIKSGQRGTRWFIEFPITGKNVDAFSLILSTEKILQNGREKEGSKVTSTDSFLKGEIVSYLIDYEVNSSTG